MMQRQPTLRPTLQLLAHGLASVAVPLLALAGLTLLVVAAFALARPLGYAAAGVACLAAAVYVESWRAPDVGTVDQQGSAARGRVTPAGGPI